MGRRRWRGGPWGLFLLVPAVLALVGVANIAIALTGFLFLSRSIAVVLAVVTLLLLVVLFAAATAFAMRAMRAAQRARDDDRRQRLAEVAHDIRTPLAVIRGEAEAITDGVHPPDAEHLGRIRDAVAAVEALVADLGSLTDSDAGPMPLRTSPVDIAELVDSALDGLRDTASAAQVTLVADVAQDLPEVEWDGGRVRRALQNLVANAVRHTPAGGRVTVSAHAAGREIELAVADTGRGFDPAVLPRAFDRYVKDEGSPGSGLGLAIARDVVEAHGGRVAAMNATAGGASVTLWLPGTAVRGTARR